MLRTVSVATLVVGSTCDAVLTPSTSLDTLPVVYMGGNSASRPAANIDMLAKMRYVVIEKWEGPCWDDCLTNLTKKNPPVQCESSCHEEEVQMATLKAVKDVNATVPGIFYLNTILDFHFLVLHKRYVEEDALIYNVDGSLCQLINDNGMTNITAFDYSKPIAQKLWLDTIKNLTATGLVDGFYGDTMQIYATENQQTGLWELCKKSHHTCCEMNATTAAAYNAGKNATMQAAADFLGKDAVFFKTTDFLIGAHSAPQEMAQQIQAQLAIMPYVHMTAGDQTTDHDPKDISSECTTDMIAAFLLALEPGAFLGCNGWDDENMGRPLGSPLFPMRTAGHMLFRNFSTGTYVTYDTRKKKGQIHWSA